MSENAPLLNPRRHDQAARSASRSAKLTALEQRFYSAAPRFEETVRRFCGRSVVVFRSDTGDSIMRGFEDLERDYDAARADSMAQQRVVADLEARYGAAIVLVHLQLLGKLTELDEIAETGTPVPDVRRLASNLAPICAKLADIEARASIATTGDLNEEERLRIKHFSTERVTRIAAAVQLRREAQAALKRHNEGVAANDKTLTARAAARTLEIKNASARLRAQGDLAREVALDRVLKQVDQLLLPISA